MSKQLVKDRQSTNAKSARLRKIREMINMTSDEFARAIGITRQTLSTWENADIDQSGLPSKGAENIINALMKYGIYCDCNWLLLGEGDEPYWLTDGIGERESTAYSSNTGYPQDTRATEIKLFENNHLNTVVMQVKHNGMNPVIQRGDWIGGCWRTMSPKLLDNICIIETSNYLEVRLIRGRSIKGYNLRFLTYPAEITEPFELIEQNPVKVAPVTRVWRI